MNEYRVLVLIGKKVEEFRVPALSQNHAREIMSYRGKVLSVEPIRS